MTNERDRTWSCDEARVAMMNGATPIDTGGGVPSTDPGLAAHVAGCEECAAAWDVQSATRQKLAQVAWPKPSIDFEAALRAVPEDDARATRSASSSAGSTGLKKEPRLRPLRRLEVGLALGAVAGITLALVRAFETMPESTVVQPHEDATATVAPALATATTESDLSAGYPGPSRIDHIRVTADVTGTVSDGSTYMGLRFEPAQVSLPIEVAQRHGITDTLRLPAIDLNGLATHRTIEVPIDPPLAHLSSVMAHVYVLPNDQLPPPGTWLVIAETWDLEDGEPMQGTSILAWADGTPGKSHPMERGPDERPWLAAETDADGRALIPISWPDLVQQLPPETIDPMHAVDTSWPNVNLAFEFVTHTLIGDLIRANPKTVTLPLGQPGPSWSPDSPPASWQGPPATRVTTVMTEQSDYLPRAQAHVSFAYSPSLTGTLPDGYVLVPGPRAEEPAGFILNVDAELANRLREAEREDGRLSRTWSAERGLIFHLPLPLISLDGLRHWTQRVVPVLPLRDLGIVVPQEHMGIDGRWEEPETVTVTLNIIPEEAVASNDESVILVEVRDAAGSPAPDVPVAIVLQHAEVLFRSDGKLQTWRPEASMNRRELELSTTRTDAFGYAIWRLGTGGKYFDGSDADGKPVMRSGKSDPVYDGMIARILALSGFDRLESNERLRTLVQVHAGSEPLPFDPLVFVDTYNPSHEHVFELGLNHNTVRLQLKADGTGAQAPANPTAEAGATATAIAESGDTE